MDKSTARHRPALSFFGGASKMRRETWGTSRPERESAQTDAVTSASEVTDALP